MKAADRRLPATPRDGQGGEKGNSIMVATATKESSRTCNTFPGNVILVHYQYIQELQSVSLAFKQRM